MTKLLDLIDDKTDLRELVEKHVPRVSVWSTLEAFHHDALVFKDYFSRVYGDWADQALTGNHGIDQPTPGDVVLFPVRSGMDPRDAETAAWAVFAAERVIFDEETGKYRTFPRFPDTDDMFLLLDAGVPLSYANSVTAPWGEYPTTDVIAGWREGVPADYLSVVL
jgi:hypothetical protein